MVDPRVQRLAKSIIEYSVRLQPGERILIESTDSTGEQTVFVNELVKHAYAVGGLPFVTLKNPSVTRQLVMEASVPQLEKIAHYELMRMRDMQAYVAVRGGANINEMSDVPSKQMNLYEQHVKHVVHTNQRVKHTKWCVMRWPSPSMAQSAGKSTEAFEDFYFDVCCLDYSKMSKAMDHLVARMERTDRVRLVGPGTDLEFSIRGIPAIKCAGTANIPDGEVYTAPVRTSVNGMITFNTPSPYHGVTFENISFTFRDGKIIEASANETERINEILDTDEGARYVGEFSIACNPFIRHPMKDTLFDEKIDGSFHFTPGECYDEAPNGNTSAIHWDLVNIQRPEYGGGEIWFDGELIRKDGRFVVADLECLNPENLQ